MSFRSVRRRPAPAVGVALVLIATSCGADSPGPGASPSPSAASGNLVNPPAAPLVPGESTPAAIALVKAATRTAEAGAMRMRISGTVRDQQSGHDVVIAGSGEASSAARSHVATTLTVNGRVATTEATTYDGTTWVRSVGGAWRRAKASASSADPRRYLNYLAGVTGVVDTGAESHSGTDTEHFRARATTVSAVGETPSAAPVGPGLSPPARASNLDAWVERASGRLIALEVTITGAGQGGGALAVDFYDFGASITVTPPAGAT